MREKLIELIRDGRYDAEAICNLYDDCKSCPLSADNANCKYACIADHLIANGVTIPVRCKECRYYNTDGEYCGMWGECRHPEHFCDEGLQEETLGTIVDDILRLKGQLRDEIDFDYNAEDV